MNVPPGETFLPAAAPGRARRFIPALLVLEFLGLSIFIEFPSSGPALRLVSAARLLIPVVVGGGAGAWLISRFTAQRRGDAFPAWPRGRRPWWPLAAHLAAFGATAALGWRLMGPGAPPGSAGKFATWLACVAATFVFAAAVIAPLGELLRHAIRHLGGPLLALATGILSWRAMVAAERLWAPLQGATLGAAAAILRVFSRDVVVDPVKSVIGLRGFEVEVAPSCSGVDGLGLVIVFLAVWLSLAGSRLRTGRAFALLLPLGAVAALAANVLRIAVLVLVGASGREELALGAFHSKLGWLLFLVVAFALAATAERLPSLQRDVTLADSSALPPAAAAHVAPLVAALATALVTSLFAGAGFDPWYGARLAAATAVLALVRGSLPRPALSSPWAPVALGLALCVVWIPWGGASASTLGEALAALAPGERTAWIAVRLVGACVVIPVVEELAFRGFLLPWLAGSELDAAASRPWPWFAILLSSAAFGALHEQWLLGTVAGIVFGVARTWRGRLGDAVVAHAACNAGLAAAVLLGGRWDLWG